MLERGRRFVLAHTALAEVPLVPEIRIHTATEVTPLWRATERWLAARSVNVPFWSVPWAGGQALARYLLDHPGEVRGKVVVDAGSGSALCAIAAAMAGASRVVAIDVDPLAAAACALNAAENGVEVEARVGDASAAPSPEVALAGDVWYERPLADRMLPWLRAAARALTGDPGRAYAPEATVLATYEVPTTLDLESCTSRTTRVLSLSR